MTIGHHRRGGLGRHDAAAAAAGLSSVLRQHPVHDGVAAHGLPEGGGGSHDGSAGGLEQRGGSRSAGSGGRSCVAAAGVEVLVVEQLCGVKLARWAGVEGLGSEKCREALKCRCFIK